jgi:hypothetical protein
MQYPGSENLLKQGFNDRISSFSCGGYQEQYKDKLKDEVFSQV